MSHLSQVIAIEKDTKDRAAAHLAVARTIFGSSKVFSGLSRSYTPREDDGETLPPESTRVQTTVTKTIKEANEALVALFDVVATKDAANCIAKADVIVDGTVLLKDVAATTILFLEKQLAELLNFVKSIPTLDAAEEWRYDAAQDCWATPPVETVRSKKVMKTHVAYEATDKHPAQVQVYNEDLAVGKWRTVKHSGAMPAADHNAIIARIEKVQRAVKFAREEANRQEVTQQHIGSKVLQYVFG
jgi:hypothetical protein